MHIVRGRVLLMLLMNVCMWDFSLLTDWCLCMSNLELQRTNWTFLLLSQKGSRCMQACFIAPNPLFILTKVVKIRCDEQKITYWVGMRLWLQFWVIYCHLYMALLHEPFRSSLYSRLTRYFGSHYMQWDTYTTCSIFGQTCYCMFNHATPWR